MSLTTHPSTPPSTNLHTIDEENFLLADNETKLEIVFELLNENENNDEWSAAQLFKNELSKRAKKKSSSLQSHLVKMPVKTARFIKMTKDRNII